MQSKTIPDSLSANCSRQLSHEKATFNMGEIGNLWNYWALVATVSRLAEASGKNRGSFGLNFSVVAAVTISPPEASLPVSSMEKL